MPHALPTCGRVAAWLTLVAIGALALTSPVASAGSTSATLTVSVTVSPTCLIRNDENGYDLSCGGGAERTSRVVLEEPLAPPQPAAWFYAPPAPPVDAHALSRNPLRPTALDPWALQRPGVPAPPRTRPVVLSVNF